MGRHNFKMNPKEMDGKAQDSIPWQAVVTVEMNLVHIGREFLNKLSPCTMQSINFL